MPSFERGYRRRNFHELLGWSEVVALSGRKAPTVAQMRDENPDFPTPVVVLTATPVYLAAEVRKFFDSNPRTRTNITPEMHQQILDLRESGHTGDRVAEMLDISATTVAKYERLPLQ